jgi:hypothetical protein
MDKLCCPDYNHYVRNFTVDWDRHLNTKIHERCKYNKIPDLLNELWKQLPENTTYLIYNKGRVKCYESFPKLREDKDGYLLLQCKYDGKLHQIRVGRLVCKLFIPNPNNYPVIDHIDKNRKNDDISNLRWVNNQMNAINRNIQSNNTSGYTGISFDFKSSQYYVHIKFNGVLSNLGLYDTLEETVKIRKNAELNIFNIF